MRSGSRPGLRWSRAIWECPDWGPSGPVFLGKSQTGIGTARFGPVQTGFQSVWDRTSPTLIRESRLESLDNFASRMAQATEEARAALVKAADDMARFYDAHRREAPQYNVGDKVWLSSENVRTARPTKKLDYKWLGPYVVEQVISCSAYRLKLPASFSKTHPVFSVTLLRPFEGDSIAERQEHHPPVMN